MTTSIPSSPTAAWANLRRLYPVYTALAQEFGGEMSACLELEEQIAVPPAEAVSEAEKWFAEVDRRIQVHHLRQFVQTSSKINEQVLQDLLFHHLVKTDRTDNERDKVDFLAVQLFSQQAPENLDSELTLKTVAVALEPVLGDVETDVLPEFIGQLDGLIQEAKGANSLKSLFTLRVIERGREIKTSCGEIFFQPQSIVAFARFGFLIRRTFFRLMHHDLNAILEGLRELESNGVTTLDCRKAQFAADEPIARLRMICQSWKVMFHAEYSSGQPLCILVDLRTAVEAAQSQHPARNKAKAAAASSTGASSAVPEFEVSSGSAEWDPNGSDRQD